MRSDQEFFQYKIENNSIFVKFYGSQWTFHKSILDKIVGKSITDFKKEYCVWLTPIELEFLVEIYLNEY